jgi:hypothetical protein
MTKREGEEPKPAGGVKLCRRPHCRHMSEYHGAEGCAWVQLTGRQEGPTDRLPCRCEGMVE